MAVSHQWFIQWSSPSLVYADIHKQYDNVNPRWDEPQRPVKELFKTNFSTSNQKPVYEHEFEYEDDQSGFYNYLHNRPNFSNEAHPYIKKDYGPEPPKERPVYKYDYEHKHKGNTVNTSPTRATGLSLWMTLLGLVQTQSFPAESDTPPFNTLFKWNLIDFHFPSAAQRRYALDSGKYIPANVLPLGLEVWGSRVFVTLPSWRRGVPATLATVAKDIGLDASPLLAPYPDWSYHRAFSDDENCTVLTSVFRINADSCGRLWVLDSGQINSQNNPQQLCPPSLVVFDLRTDQMLGRYPIPKKYVLQDSLFANIIVDTRTDDCSDVHVYIADTWRFGLLVFRESDISFWRFSHHLFYPDPFASNYSLHGLNFQWPDGIFGLSLSPVQRTEERILYFHSLSSYYEFYVSTDVLQNPFRVNNSAMEFNLVGESRGQLGQASASFIDRRGVMFYGLVSRDSVGCWDTNKPYVKSTMGVVAISGETLVFPNDIKVDQESRQNVWVISNKLPMFQAGSLDSEDFNYRILYADVDEAVRGTVCDPNQREVSSNKVRYWVH